jgi:hypothetical protein
MHVFCKWWWTLKTGVATHPHSHSHGMLPNTEVNSVESGLMEFYLIISSEKVSTIVKVEESYISLFMGV